MVIHADLGDRPSTVPRDFHVVVRFGLLKPADVALAAELHQAKYGVRALSVYSGPTTAAEIAMGAGLPHTWFRISTVGRLRVAGLAVTTPDERGHCLILLPDVATPAEADILNACFDSPELNPNRGGNK